MTPGPPGPVVAGTAPAPPPPTSWSGYSGREIAALAGAVVRRPDLWWTAVGELRRMAPHLWWRTAPHLPLPDRRLWEFRMVTAYGRPDAVPERGDVIAFLEWCRATAPSPGTTSSPGPDGDG